MKIENLNIASPLLNIALNDNFVCLSSVETQAIPAIISGQDVFISSPNGTGKSTSLVLATLHKLTMSRGAVNQFGLTGTRALFLCSDELCATALEQSIKHYGQRLQLSCLNLESANQTPRISVEIVKPIAADIIIATPISLQSANISCSLDLSTIQLLNIINHTGAASTDFFALAEIAIRKLPRARQTTYSTTLPQSQSRYALTWLKPDYLVSKPDFGNFHQKSMAIKFSIYKIELNKKSEFLAHIILKNNWKNTLVYTKNDDQSLDLSKQLKSLGVKVATLSSLMIDEDHTNTLAGFIDSTQYDALIVSNKIGMTKKATSIQRVVHFDAPVLAEQYLWSLKPLSNTNNIQEAILLIAPTEELNLRNIENLLGEKMAEAAFDSHSFTIHSKKTNDRLNPSQSNSNSGTHLNTEHNTNHLKETADSIIFSFGSPVEFSSNTSSTHVSIDGTSRVGDLAEQIPTQRTKKSNTRSPYGRINERKDAKTKTRHMAPTTAADANESLSESPKQHNITLGRAKNTRPQNTAKSKVTHATYTPETISDDSFDEPIPLNINHEQSSFIHLTSRHNSNSYSQHGERTANRPTFRKPNNQTALDNPYQKRESRSQGGNRFPRPRPNPIRTNENRPEPRHQSDEPPRVRPDHATKFQSRSHLNNKQQRATSRNDGIKDSYGEHQPPRDFQKTKRSTQTTDLVVRDQVSNRRTQSSFSHPDPTLTSVDLGMMSRKNTFSSKDHVHRPNSRSLPLSNAGYLGQNRRNRKN